MIGEFQLFSLRPSTISSKISRINQFTRWCGNRFALVPIRANDVGRFVKDKIEANGLDAEQCVASYMGDVWRSLILLTDDLRLPLVEDIASGEVTRGVITANLTFAVKNLSAQARILHVQDEARMAQLSSRLATTATIWMLSGMRISGMLQLNVVPVWDSNCCNLTFSNKTATKTVAPIPCICSICSQRCVRCFPILFPKLPFSKSEVTRIVTWASIPSGSFRRALATTFMKCSVYLGSKVTFVRDKYVQSVLSRFGWAPEKLLRRYAKGYGEIDVDSLPLSTRHLVTTWGEHFKKYIHRQPSTIEELSEILVNSKRHRVFAALRRGKLSP